MWDTVDTVIGKIVSIIGYASHLVIVSFRNILFLIVMFAFLWGGYKACVRGIRYLRGMRGDELDHGRRNPKGTPEDSSI
ncbi:MAG: hypothetical protein J2P49_07110 [Methylocapsa sp.]|nr:hypothetical protein [Methylocapsa sp.]